MRNNYVNVEDKLIVASKALIELLGNASTKRELEEIPRMQSNLRHLENIGLELITNIRYVSYLPYRAHMIDWTGRVLSEVQRIERHRMLKCWYKDSYYELQMLVEYIIRLLDEWGGRTSTDK